MTDLISLDEITPMILPDGTELDQRQSLAILLRTTSTLDIDEIAERCGYSGRSTCSHFLRSDKGKAGVQLAVRQHLLDGARVGLQTMVSLATSARSENVRQMAAADLLDRAGYRASETEQQLGTGNREVNISINLNSEDTSVTIEGEAQHLQEIPLATPTEGGG